MVLVVQKHGIPAERHPFKQLTTANFLEIIMSVAGIAGRGKYFDFARSEKNPAPVEIHHHSEPTGAAFHPITFSDDSLPGGDRAASPSGWLKMEIGVSGIVLVNGKSLQCHCVTHRILEIDISVIVIAHKRE